MKNNLSNSLAYRKFTRQRDDALETLHLRFLSETSDQMRKVFHDVAAFVYRIYAQHKAGGFSHLKLMVNYIDQQIESDFQKLEVALIAMAKVHRRDTYILSHVGESEAIGRGLGVQARFNPNQHLRKIMDQPSPAGGTLEKRFHFILSELRRRLVQSVHKSAITEVEPEEMLKSLVKKFPKERALPAKRKTLKKVTMTEAESKDPTFSSGFIDDQEWDSIVNKYLNDYIPTFRGPDAVLEMKGKTPTKDDYYAWQLEQELTQDFVYQVRLGQIDAAKENGIEDFIWIAIVDDKTDDCCLWRDGLTSEEIEKELKKRKNDVCQSVVPPAHYNCRCTLAPATEKTINTKIDVGAKDFETWLNQ